MMTRDPQGCSEPWKFEESAPEGIAVERASGWYEQWKKGPWLFRVM